MLLGGISLSVQVHHNPSFQKNIFLFVKKQEFNIHMLGAFFAFLTFSVGALISEMILHEVNSSWKLSN
jgi:hypothetical protein